MGPQMHMGCVQPTKPGFTSLLLRLDPLFCSCHEFVIAGLHALLGERPGILDLLLSHSPVAWIGSGIVFVACPAMQYTARCKLLIEFREIFFGRPVRKLRLFFGIQVVEVAKKFVKSMYGWQIFVTVTQMVL